MPRQYKEIIYSTLLGTLLGIVGVFLMGFITAIAIPEAFFESIENTQLLLAAINVVSQFFGFGVIAIAIGTIIGRLSKKWLLNSVVCYLAFLLYLSVGTALIYGGEISSPYVGFTSYDFLSILLVPACLLMATLLSARKL